MEIRKNILLRITTHLEKHAISRRAFCLNIGIDHRTVQFIERDQGVNLSTLEKIEKYLDHHETNLSAAQSRVTGIHSENFPEDCELASGAAE